MKLKEKLTNKRTITIITVVMYIIAMLIFDVLYCNTGKVIEILNGTEDYYSISVCRIVVYILFFILYFAFKDRFLENAIKANENKYKRVFIYLAIITTILAVPASIAIIMWNLIYIRAISIALITMIMGTLLLIYVSNDIIKNIIVVIFTVGMVFPIVTRFNHTCDEKKHFMSAVNISYLNFDYVNNPITDLGLEELPQLSKYTTVDKFLKSNYDAEKSNDVDINDVPSTPANYTPILYIAPAIGIALARILGGSIIDVYILGRIFNLILYGALACVAIKILPYKKNIFAVIFLMPLSLLLAATYSVDGICIVLVSIFIAYCLKLKKEKEAISLKDFFILLCVFVLLLLAKSMAYVFVALIIFMLPLIQTLKKNKKYLPVIITIAIISAILIGFLAIYVKNTKITSDTRAAGATNVSEQLENMIHNPVFTLKVIGLHILNTLFNFNWITQLHLDVFFGTTSMAVSIPLVLFVLYIALTEDDYHFKIKDRIIMIVSFLLTMIMTSMVLYISFTPVGSTTIAGYQTRYILPMLSLILFSISTKKVKSVAGNNRNMNICITSAAFIVIGILQSIIV